MNETNEIFEIRYYGYRKEAPEINGSDHVDYESNVEIIYDTEGCRLERRRGIKYL